MKSADILFFLRDMFYGLGEIGAGLIDFLNTQPIPAYDWTWGSIIFGTAVFGFFTYAVIVWLIP